jgi:predicted O-linked N-acetylglucosamine transferase (SPINDLY family)
MPFAPPPLVGRVLDDAGPALGEALRALQLEVNAMPSRTAAAELAARLDAAVTANQSHEIAVAKEGYDALLAEQPGHAPTLYLRGTLSREAGDAEAALADFTAAAKAAPRDAKSWAAAAQVEIARHATTSARALVDQGLALAPDDAGLLRTLGHVERDEHNAAASLNAFARAVALHPMDADTHYNYGVALQTLRLRPDAARAYQRALALAPDMLEAHFNLGILFHEQGDTDAAITALEWVIARQPQRAEAHRMLVDILDLARRHEAWKAAVRRFERSCPDALGLVGSALEYYQYLGDFRTVENYLGRVAREKFKPADDLDLADSLEQLLFLLLYFDLDPGVMAAFYRSYDRVAQHVYGPPRTHAEPRRPGRVRIGYLSADMRDHVMGRMMVGPLSLHDRERFAVHCYSTSPAAEDDAVTAQYVALADEFVHLDALTDAAAAERIAADDLDLLVDLSTHTKGARPGILARKPARVQMTHAASAGALGLSAVDFKLTDRFCDRPENAAELVEKLLPMDGCLYPFRRMTAGPDHPYHRDRLGIAPDDVVIGALVTPLKLSRRTLALWKEILERVPHARLAFSPNAPWMLDTYPRLLTAAGINPDRAILLPQGRNESERLGRYTLVDFVLDPMPYGNVNGTLEPLNMGVPVVTLCGSSHGERTDYVAIAVRLATDAAFMRAVRTAIAGRLAEPPLAALRTYTQNLEAAYLRALELAREGGDVAWSNSDAITGA